VRVGHGWCWCAQLYCNNEYSWWLFDSLFCTLVSSYARSQRPDGKPL